MKVRGAKLNLAGGRYRQSMSGPGRHNEFHKNTAKESQLLIFKVGDNEIVLRAASLRHLMPALDE